MFSYGGGWMGKFKITETGIEKLIILEPHVYKDDRGYFYESFNLRDLQGITANFVQDNQVGSTKGVLRGLHYQKDHQQDKLVRVLWGEIFDVAVDLRRNSNTYKKWFGTILSHENKKQLFVPEGFAHGYLVLSNRAEVLYKCSDYYHPESEGGIPWNDPQIAIDWPVVNIEEIILSEKDKNWKNLTDNQVVL